MHVHLRKPLHGERAHRGRSSMPVGKEGDSSRLQGLDGWRTVSVALVILSHLVIHSSIHINDGYLSAFLEPLGAVGVHIFFVISGFVICRGLIVEREATGSVSLLGFYLRRCLRILPPLALYVAVVIVLGREGLVDDNGVVRTLTFTCNILPQNCGGYLGGHTWSLAVEEQFYLVAPVAFILAARRFVRLSTGGLILISAAALGLSGLGWKIASAELASFIPIAAGVAAAAREAEMRRFVTRMPGWTICAALALVPVLVPLLVIRVSTLATIVLAIALAYILLATVFRGGLLHRLMSNPTMTGVGRATYGIYLWQQLATYAFPAADAAFYALSIAAAVMWSLVQFYAAERYLNRLGRALTSRLRKRGVGMRVESPEYA